MSSYNLKRIFVVSFRHFLLSVVYIYFIFSHSSRQFAHCCCCYCELLNSSSSHIISLCSFVLLYLNLFYVIFPVCSPNFSSSFSQISKYKCKKQIKSKQKQNFQTLTKSIIVVKLWLYFHSGTGVGTESKMFSFHFSKQLRPFSFWKLHKSSVEELTMIIQKYVCAECIPSNVDDFPPWDLLYSINEWKKKWTQLFNLTTKKLTECCCYYILALKFGWWRASKRVMDGKLTHRNEQQHQQQER